MLPDEKAPEESDAEKLGTDLVPDDPGERFAESDTDGEDMFDLEIPSAPTFSGDDADPEIQREFWAQVILFNVALMGVCLGILILVFEGRWQFGGASILVGLLAGFRGWRRYQRVTEEKSDDESSDDSDE